MAKPEVHAAQAEHNRTVARSLLEPPRHDWAITVGFYCAIHSFEAFLYLKPQQHTETSIPVGSNGPQMSPHAWRDTLVQQYLPKDLARTYRKLRTASQTSRYLSDPTGGAALGVPAHSHFTLAAARSLIELELERLHRALRLERWCDELGFEGINRLAGPLLRRKIIQNYQEESAVMKAPAAELGRLFGQQELATLKAALSAKGIVHPNL
jgi:hypothetical protein